MTESDSCEIYECIRPDLQTQSPNKFKTNILLNQYKANIFVKQSHIMAHAISR